MNAVYAQSNTDTVSKTWLYLNLHEYSHHQTLEKFISRLVGLGLANRIHVLFPNGELEERIRLLKSMKDIKAILAIPPTPKKPLPKLVRLAGEYSLLLIAFAWLLASLIVFAEPAKPKPNPAITHAPVSQLALKEKPPSSKPQ